MFPLLALSNNEYNVHIMIHVYDKQSCPSQPLSGLCIVKGLLSSVVLVK